MTRSSCAAAVLLFLGIAAASAADTTLRVGGHFPSFTLSDLQGRPVTLPEASRGKVCVVHFWTDACGNCIVEMPAIESLYAQYKARGFEVYAINVAQAAAQIIEFTADMKLTYQILLDSDGSIAKKCGVVGLPRTFILGRDGKIKNKIIGEASKDTLARMIAAAL